MAHAGHAEDGDRVHWSLDTGRWLYTARTPRKTAQRIAPTPDSRERNPFVVFKRLVDRGFGAFASQERRQQAARQPLDRERDKRQGWYGRSRSHGRRSQESSWDDSVNATSTLLYQAEWNMRDVSPDAIGALFQDEESENERGRKDTMADAMLAFGGACYFSPDVGDRVPSAAMLFRPPSRSYRWLSIDWFKHSPYSPSNVEAIQNMPGPHESWRAAFEDLLNTALGRSLPF